MEAVIESPRWKKLYNEIHAPLESTPAMEVPENTTPPSSVFANYAFVFFLVVGVLVTGALLLKQPENKTTAGAKKEI